jgi:hypothetical protein
MKQAWQPIEEKNAERELIKNYAAKTNGKVIKLQDDNDDGKTDGTVEWDAEQRNVEARRKGYPNHRGKVCFFKDGWDTTFLADGIILNERTIRNHKDKGFDFVVEIKGFKPRVTQITSSMVDELLKQPYQTMESTNSGAVQSVKKVPLGWFQEY